MKRVILSWMVIFSLIFCYSCKEREPVFPEVKHLTAEKIEGVESLGIMGMVIYKDLLTISSVLTMTKVEVSVYSWPDLEFLYKIAPKGRGPDEAPQFAILLQSNNSDYMYVMGINSMLNIRKFTVDSTRSLLPLSDYSIGRLPSGFGASFIINDSLYVADDLFHKIVEKYDIINQEFLGDIKYATEESNSSRNSDEGVILANESEISYVYKYRPDIYIYDLNTLELKRKIKLKSKKVSLPIDQKNPYYVYPNAFAGKKYYYLLYAGAYAADYHPGTSQLEVYDHDWNPVIKYTFDIDPLIFIVDEDRGLILGSGRSDDLEEHLFMYDINK